MLLSHVVNHDNQLTTDTQYEQDRTMFNTYARLASQPQSIMPLRRLLSTLPGTHPRTSRILRNNVNRSLTRNNSRNHNQRSITHRNTPSATSIHRIHLTRLPGTINRLLHSPMYTKKSSTPSTLTSSRSIKTRTPYNHTTTKPHESNINLISRRRNTIPIA